MADVKNPIRFLRLDALREALSQSLFFVPFTMVAFSVLLSQTTVWIDRQIAPDVLPGWFASTVESSRAILSAVAGGTITAASIVFSLTLVAVQLAASQFSPRVLRGFLGDRFQQVVMGTVVGTFSYSLFVLREVETTGESGRGAFLPQVSIAVALVFAVLSLIAILASIDHTAKGLRVGSVADGILATTLATIDRLFVEREDGPSEDGSEPAVVIDAPGRSPAPSNLPSKDSDTSPPDDARVLLAPRTGWITGVQAQSLARSVPEGTSVLVPAAVGTYVVEGTPLVTLWPASDDVVEHIRSELGTILRIGNVRTMQQDVGFGIVQLVDIAVRALSPGVNDPNTASEVVVRLGAILTRLYRSDLPPQRASVDGRWIIRPDEPDYAAYVDLAIEPIRRCARHDPRVLEVLARTIAGVRDDARRRFDDPGVDALERQLELMGEELDVLETDEDRRRVRDVLEGCAAN